MINTTYEFFMTFSNNEWNDYCYDLEEQFINDRIEEQYFDNFYEINSNNQSKIHMSFCLSYQTLFELKCLIK